MFHFKKTLATAALGSALALLTPVMASAKDRGDDYRRPQPVAVNHDRDHHDSRNDRRDFRDDRRAPQKRVQFRDSDRRDRVNGYYDRWRAWHWY